MPFSKDKICVMRESGVLFWLRALSCSYSVVVAGVPLRKLIKREKKNAI